MLALALRHEGRRILPFRVIAGAMTGACIAGWTRAAELARILGMVLWLPTAMLMMAIAGGRRRRMLSGGLLLLCAAGLLGGIMQALLGATGSYAAAYMLGSAAAALIALHAVCVRKYTGSVMRVTVVMAYREKEAAFEAMIDSGNTLGDYLTHLPVIVLPQKEARERLGIGDAPLRPIFADTAGGRLMMECFIPERTFIRTGETKTQVRCAAALSPGLNDGALALVPPALLNGDECRI